MNLTFINRGVDARRRRVVAPRYMASPEPPAARSSCDAPPPPPTPRTNGIEEIVVHMAELLEVRPTDTLLVPMPETWTPRQIKDFAVALDTVLRQRNIHVAGILRVPGGRNDALRVQVLRQTEIA